MNDIKRLYLQYWKLLNIGFVVMKQTQMYM